MSFAATGKLNPCFLFTYRLPVAVCQKLLPSGLRPVTRQEWGFLSIFACGVEHFRPQILPPWLGLSYRHVAYRIYATASTEGDPNLTGMYFLRSDVDRFLLAATGNWSSDLHFRYAKIQLKTTAGESCLDVNPRDGQAKARIEFNRMSDFERSSNSCFTSNNEAQAFLKYQPIGIALDSSGKNLKLVEVIREGSVSEKPIRVLNEQWGYFTTLGIPDAQLELATEMTPVSCIWKMGRREALSA